MCTSLSVSPAALVLKNGVGTARQRRSGGRSGVSQAWGKLPPSRVRRPIEVGGGGEVEQNIKMFRVGV